MKKSKKMIWQRTYLEMISKKQNRTMISQLIASTKDNWAIPITRLSNFQMKKTNLAIWHHKNLLWQICSQLTITKRLLVLLCIKIKRHWNREFLSRLRNLRTIIHQLIWHQHLQSLAILIKTRCFQEIQKEIMKLLMYHKRKVMLIALRSSPQRDRIIQSWERFLRVLENSQKEEMDHEEADI